MRDSLKKSLADSPVRGFEKYLRGSVVLCNACSAPIFRLERSICVGDGAGRMASAFVPVSPADLDVLAGRDDVDAGVRALVASWTREQRHVHCEKLHTVNTGEPMLCPICGGCFAQVIAVSKSEVMDKAYTVELVTIPPYGNGTPVPVRGRQLGVNKGWVH